MSDLPLAITWPGPFELVLLLSFGGVLALVIYLIIISILRKANYTYREIAGLTSLLRVLLGLGVTMALVSLLSSFMQAELLSRGSFSEAEGQANDYREQVIGLLHLALYLFTVVIFGLWIVRANKNVRALGAAGLRITPAWAVGYFFVPIANLWRPYQAMKDLWRASHKPTAWGGHYRRVHSAGMVDTMASFQLSRSDFIPNDDERAGTA